ncbi:MAG: SIMPL domain-containing protein [Halovenus sp.]
MERNHLAVLLAGLAVLAFVGVGALTVAGSNDVQPMEEPSDDRVIHVSGVGTVDTAPDQAVLDVAITAEGDETGPVRDELSTGSAELTEALDELGVEYETSEYNIRQDRHPRDDDEKTVYRGAHAFEITVDNPDRVGEVIDSAVDAGAEIGSVRLTLSDEARAELRNDAIEAAMDDASQQAETIAATSGLEVTDVSTVDASQRSFRPVAYDGGRAVAESDASGAPPTRIETGEVTVTYRVSVAYNATTG